MPETVSSYPFLEPPTSDDFLGSLAHYRVVSELGRGGMGFVFRAEDIKLKRSVALKVMNQKISEASGSRKRFISEARAMAAIHHDNVATIFEVGESGGTPFMAMEMLKGETLEALNRRKERLGYETIIKYATDIARGLEAAHVRGIVHRDIKPANIWIETEKSRIKILDFGLALASTPVDQLAGRGSVVGTPGYLSPEQARSDPLDNRSDLYSLGVVLYELCTGKLPIHSKSVHQQLISILAHRPKPIEEVNPDIPKPLRDMIHRLLRKEPRSRFQSARQLEEELKVVEEACHQQSEVALAINRLQAGLEQAVTTGAVPAAPIPVPVVEAGVENGFAGIDEIPAPAMDPLAIPAGPLGQPGTISGAYPTVNPHAAVKNRAVKKKPANSQGLPAHLPLILGGGLVLVALPLIAYFLMGIGRTSNTAVVELSADTAPVATIATGKEFQPEPTKPKVVEPKQKKKSKSKAAKSKAARSKDEPKNEPDVFDVFDAPTSTDTVVEEDKPERNSPVKESTKSSDSVVVEKPALELEPEKKTSPSGYSGPTQVVSITTTDQRGADAMVQKGSGDKLGLRPSIGIRTRGGSEINHTYLRFDVSQLKGRGKEIQDARLILNVFGSKVPLGAELRLIGIKGGGLWPEDRISWGNSPSNERSSVHLSSFPVVAETTLDKASMKEHPGKVYLGGPKLSEFLRQENDTVTLAIAGQWNERLLRFKSREKSAEESPLLQLVLPK